MEISPNDDGIDNINQAPKINTENNQEIDISKVFNAYVNVSNIN